MSDVFNEKELMDRVEDDVEFLAETVAMLDEDCPGLLGEIRAAAAARDAAALVKPAHALKGMVANFCAGPAEAAARDLEVMGRENRLDDVEVAVARAEAATDRLRQTLRAFVQRMTP